MKLTNAGNSDVTGMSAQQGDFVFARTVLCNGEIRSSPFFVLGVDSDPEDVIVCKCTTSSARSEYDIPVQLRMPTSVRSNKIYTIGRNQLLFPIPQKPSAAELANILNAVRRALGL